MVIKAECPSCGSDDVFGVTRVVGYFAIIENMNDSKQAEIIDRKLGDYRVNDEPIKPLKFSFGEDKVYLIGKEQCEICTSEIDVIRCALAEAGCDGEVPLEEKKLADRFGAKLPMNLAFAVRANVDLNRIPAVVAVKDNKIKYIGYLGDKKKPVSFEDLKENFKKIYNICPTISI